MCHDQAECINQPGEYSCMCLEGYEGNGFECENICAKKRLCGENASCRKLNSTENHACRCDSGYKVELTQYRCTLVV